MTIQQQMDMYKMTIHQFIQIIKLKGESLNLQDNIIDLPNEKYGERAVILFKDRYYVTISVLDNFKQICHYEDIEVFDSEKRARNKYDDLLEEHNAKILVN